MAKRRKPAAKRVVRRRRIGAMGMNKATVQGTVEGMLGGALAALAISSLAFVKSQPKTNQAIMLGIGSVAVAMLLKRPNVAAGMAGVAGVMLGQGVGVLAENGLSAPMYIPRITAGSGGYDVPYGLMEGGGDYAGLNDASIYSSGYANVY